MDHRAKIRAADGEMERLLAKMRSEKIPEAACGIFSRYYRQLLSGERAVIREGDITPVSPDEVQSLEQCGRLQSRGLEELPKVAVLKLNGGLGTSMGLHGPKSLLPAKNEMTFLDLTIRQIDRLNRRLSTSVPLVLMSSFFTDARTREALAGLSGVARDMPISFVQHKFPKINSRSLTAVSYPANPLLEWHPAGHGDLLLAIETSGVLRRLLDRGFRHLFVSNIDNLGAVVDPRILGYFCEERLDFLMEVTDRTAMDRKGGHLARRNGDGRLLLREASQCDERDKSSFSDTARHPLFNTNNLWIGLEAIGRTVGENRHAQMPLIINRKNLDPCDASSPDIIQIETALGSAISLFEKNGVLRVPRSRFVPVKNCDELLLLWSDWFVLDKDFTILAPAARTSERIAVALDPAWFSRLDQLQARFPSGAPSLVKCESLTVRGHVRFGREVSVCGKVTVENRSARQAVVADGAALSSDLVF